MNVKLNNAIYYKSRIFRLSLATPRMWRPTFKYKPQVITQPLTYVHKLLLTIQLYISYVYMRVISLIFLQPHPY